MPNTDYKPGAKPEICNGRDVLFGMEIDPPAARSHWGSGENSPALKDFTIFLQ